MGALIVFGLFILIGVSCIVGHYGQTREIGFTGAFFCSLFFSPFLAMLFVLASGTAPIPTYNAEKDYNTYDFIDEKGNVRNVRLITGENAGWKRK